MEYRDLKEKIKVAKNFQYSVNVGFDLGNKEKIKEFIPTTAALDIMEDLILSTANSSTDRARILIGAYGKGKSHIILVVLSLLSGKDPEQFQDLLLKIKDYNNDLYNYTLNYIESGTKLLPVIIQGGNTSLAQSFLVALQQALEAEGLDDIMPETHFKSAIERINVWKENYPDTYRKFINIINQPANEFLLRLAEFDVEAYEQFVSIYPTLTSGSAFNPFFGFDVIEIYTAVVEKLRTKGYHGIFVLYDEFSKFLETGITKISPVDIKLLQDFAEMCNRSEGNQIHLLLISHKEIANYIDKLPKQKVDGWRGVSERFKHIEVQHNYSQLYEIIASVIQKDSKFFSDFFNRNLSVFQEIEGAFANESMFSELNEEEFKTKIIYGCYPLHPVTTFILPRLSEKIAQNERTLFTFLSAPHKYTLSAYIETIGCDFPIVTPDYLYDYFEPLFKQEVYTSDIHKTYTLASTILAKLEPDSLESKIIKTIALIHIVGQYEKLPPLPTIISNTFSINVGAPKVAKVLSDLCEKQYLIYLKKSNNYLRLKNSVGIDIGRRVSELKDEIKRTHSLKKILSDVSFDNYLYPTSYNDENEIIRYFDFSFIEGSELLSVNDWNKKISDINGDGVVYGIIPQNNEEIIEIRKALLDKTACHERIVFVLPTQKKEIEDAVYEYQALKKLKEENLGDESLVEELEIYLEDLEEVLHRFISAYLRPELREAEYYYMGKKHPIYRKTQVSQLLSKICQNIYTQMPVIKNEVINKDILSSVAINSRSKVINGLLSNELQPNLGLTGTGQDIFIMRSTLVNKGILVEKDYLVQLRISGNEDEKIQNVLNVISEFFMFASKGRKTNFGQLYVKLTSPEYHIGLKKGVIPIYIAAVLHHYKQHLVVVRNNRELDITAELLNSINENPTEYMVYLENWNQAKADYINALEQIFADEIRPEEKEYNTFAYIVRAMQRWFLKLPLYVKGIKQICYGLGKVREMKDEEQRFISMLKNPEINAHEFLFKRLLSLFGVEEATFEIAERIREIKTLLDEAKDYLVNGLIKDVRALFINNQLKDSSLSSIIKDWYDELDDSTKNHLFTSGENEILELFRTVTHDEKTFIEKLAKALTGLRIDDWDDNKVNLFLEELQKFKNTVEKQNKNISGSSFQQQKNVYRITFIDGSGNQITKTFNKVKTSARGQLLVNEICAALDEYGQALTDGEKRQVLMSIIEKLS